VLGKHVRIVGPGLLAVLDAIEPFLLAGRDDVAVDDQRGGGFVKDRIYAENIQAAPLDDRSTLFRSLNDGIGPSDDRSRSCPPAQRLAIRAVVIIVLSEAASVNDRLFLTLGAS
jgi:hypothetical protein